MAEKYWKLKKSRVAGKIPSLNEIDLDTIVLNQVDAIAYIRKKGLDGDPDEVVAIAAGNIGELPDDVWRSSVANQIRVLEEEEYLSDFDAFPFEDRTDSWKKKFIKWLHIKHNLTSWFYANNTSEQIKNTPEKFSLHDDDRFLIEDNETSPIAFLKKSIRWSTIKSAVMALVFWSKPFADQNKIKTNNEVQIQSPYATATFSESKYESNTSIGTNHIIKRTTTHVSGLDDGFGVELRFALSDDLAVIDNAFISYHIPDASSGEQVLTIGAGTSKLEFFTDAVPRFNTQIGASGYTINQETGFVSWGPILDDDSWRIIRSGNNLEVQCRESGVWVTKHIFYK